ncbi:MAG: rod-binding protein [Pirellulales bacterium]
MTLIGDPNAAASFQLPVMLSPRVAALESAEKLQGASQIGGTRGTRPNLRLHGEGKSAEELKVTFTQFVGETFYGQMIKAMRSTVGKPAYFHGGRGEEVFQGQLDQQMAQHLTEATAEKFVEPLFERQFPHLAKHSHQSSTNQLSQLSRR